MSEPTGIDDLLQQYLYNDDTRVHECSQEPPPTPINFKALFEEEEEWLLQTPVLHVPEVVSAAAVRVDPRQDAKSQDDDDSDDDSDDNSDDDMHEECDEDGDEDSVHDQQGSTDAGVREGQAWPGTSKRQSPSYRLSVQELHERFKWSEKFKSQRLYMRLKIQQMDKIKRLEKNGRAFKQDHIAKMTRAKRGCMDCVDTLMYEKRIGWRKQSKAMNERGMESVCEQIMSRDEYDEFFEEDEEVTKV